MEPPRSHRWFELDMGQYHKCLHFCTVYNTHLKADYREQIYVSMNIHGDLWYAETEPMWVDEQLFIPEHFTGTNRDHIYISELLPVEQHDSFKFLSVVSPKTKPTFYSFNQKMPHLSSQHYYRGMCLRDKRNTFEWRSYLYTFSGFSLNFAVISHGPDQDGFPQDVKKSTSV